MILTDEQLVALTKKKHRDAQVRVLVALGVTHKVRPDGSILVSEVHVERLLGGVANAKVRAPAEPNWAALATTPQ
jgi:hypothetical protein